MVSAVRMLPAVLLCVALLGPTPVQARSFTEWITIICNLFRTIYYYVLPTRRRQMVAIDTTLDNLIDILKDFMPVNSPVKSHEYSKTGAYVCLSEGYGSNMKTLRKTGEARFAWESDNSVNVKIPFTIEDFTTGYRMFYLELLKTTAKRGTLDMCFDKNRMVVGLHIPNVVNMIGKLTAGAQCIVNITNIDVTYIGGMKLNLHYNGLTGGAMTSKFLTHVINQNIPLLRQSLREGILENMQHEMSKNPKNTVCLHPPLLKEIQQLHFVDERDFTNKFDTYCGENRDTPTPENKGHSFRHIFKRRRSRTTQIEAYVESATGVDIVTP